jgi:hypothetical protein
MGDPVHRPSLHIVLEPVQQERRLADSPPAVDGQQLRPLPKVNGAEDGQLVLAIEEPVTHIFGMLPDMCVNAKPSRTQEQVIAGRRGKVVVRAELRALSRAPGVARCEQTANRDVLVDAREVDADAAPDEPPLRPVLDRRITQPWKPLERHPQLTSVLECNEQGVLDERDATSTRLIRRRSALATAS